MLPKRVREVLKERARSINSCTLPAIRYSTGIINWPKEKIKATEIKNRKIMIVHGGLCQGHHPGWNDNNLSEHQWDGRSDAVLSENTKTQRRGRGMWTNQKKNVQKLGMAVLKDNTGVFLMAAPKQPLSRRSMEAGIHHLGQSLCETMSHLTAGCQVLAAGC